jgi:hypothetical protein
MGDRRIFIKTRRNTSFYKDLSNEPNFDRIHLAGQYLSEGPFQQLLLENYRMFTDFSCLICICETGGILLCQEVACGLRQTVLGERNPVDGTLHAGAAQASRRVHRRKVKIAAGPRLAAVVAEDRVAAAGGQHRQHRRRRIKRVMVGGESGKGPLKDDLSPSVGDRAGDDGDALLEQRSRRVFAQLTLRHIARSVHNERVGQVGHVIVGAVKADAEPDAGRAGEGDGGPAARQARVQLDAHCDGGRVRVVGPFIKSMLPAGRNF